MKVLTWLKEKAELITAVTVICGAILWGFKFLETKTTQIIQKATLNQTQELISKQTTSLDSKISPRLDVLDASIQALNVKQEELGTLVKNHKHRVQRVEVVVPEKAAPAPVVILPQNFLMPAPAPVATPPPQ